MNNTVFFLVSFDVFIEEAIYVLKVPLYYEFQRKLFYYKSCKISESLKAMNLNKF